MTGKSFTDRFKLGKSGKQAAKSFDTKPRPDSPILEPEAIGSTSEPAESHRNRILFYDHDRPHYCFTNFSPHSVFYNGKEYPTSEHLFQAFKFLNHEPEIAEHIRRCARPRDALEEAHRYKGKVRADWYQVNQRKMYETIRLKFTQHSDIFAELLDTGDAELVEDSKVDSFWGVGEDGKGRNELGRALMKLREEFKTYLAGAGRYAPPRASPPSSAVALPVTYPSLIAQRIPTPPTSLCVNCNRRQRDGGELYCSESCRWEAEEINGVARDAPVIPPTSLCVNCKQRQRYGGELYCSKSCRWEAEEINGVARDVPVVPPSALCLNCKQRPKYGSHAFCGKTCAREAAEKLRPSQ